MFDFLEIFPRLLGTIFFWVFFSLAKQSLGLFGSRGIDPIVDFMRILNHRYFAFPTLYWINQSDRFIQGTLWIGTLLSILLIFSIYPTVTLFLLLILYLSILVAGMDFTNFGWQSILFELSLYTWLLLLNPNQYIWWSLNFLLFRFYFVGGTCKLQSKSKEWRDLSAIYHHYLTQSIPTRLAWLARTWPKSLHQFFTLLTLGIELIVPFLIIGGTTLKFICFLFFSALQIGIWLFGNFGTLNFMVIIFSTILIADIQTTVDLFPSFIGLIFLLFQIIRLIQDLYPTEIAEKILSYPNLWHLFHSSKFYGVINRERLEVIVEGSEDGETWKEYYFHYKPGELDRMPPRIAPYITHLERNMWYLPRQEEKGWFHRFLFALLDHSDDVHKLLRINPFLTRPPKFIRSNLYLYTFTTPKEKKETGNWWKRTYLSTFTSPESLIDHR